MFTPNAFGGCPNYFCIIFIAHDGPISFWHVLTHIISCIHCFIPSYRHTLKCIHVFFFVKYTPRVMGYINPPTQLGMFFRGPRTFGWNQAIHVVLSWVRWISLVIRDNPFRTWSFFDFFGWGYMEKMLLFFADASWKEFCENTWRVVELLKVRYCWWFRTPAREPPRMKRTLVNNRRDSFLKFCFVASKRTRRNPVSRVLWIIVGTWLVVTKSLARQRFFWEGWSLT